jgi:hypothetical protein
MRRIANGVLLIVAVATATLAALSEPADAQRRARPAAEFCLRGPTGGQSCAYHTLQQCRKAASGAGGSCMRNPRFKR